MFIRNDLISGTTAALRRTIQRARPIDTDDIVLNSTGRFVGQNLLTAGAFQDYNVLDFGVGMFQMERGSSSLILILVI